MEKKNGKGKEHDCNGRLEFDGEYLDGKKWNGKGIEYKDFSKTEYEYKDGKKIFKRCF